jgi:hypothetical protein
MSWVDAGVLRESMTLEPEEFMRRSLLHVLPFGFQANLISRTGQCLSFESIGSRT